MGSSRRGLSPNRIERRARFGPSRVISISSEMSFLFKWAAADASKNRAVLARVAAALLCRFSRVDQKQGERPGTSF